MLQNFAFSFKRERLGAEKCRDQGTERLRKEKKGMKTVVKGGIGGRGWMVGGGEETGRNRERRIKIKVKS